VTSSHASAMRPMLRRRHASHAEHPGTSVAQRLPRSENIPVYGVQGAIQLVVLDGPSIIERMADVVALEEIVLAGSQNEPRVVGTIRVKAAIGDVRAAVRFTYDDWITTSELSGNFVSADERNAVNRYQFSIRLPLHHLESKILVMAVMIASAGTEIWDNNGGKNYRVKFRASNPLQLRRDRANSETTHSGAMLRLKHFAPPSYMERGPELDSPSPTHEATEDRFDFRGDIPLSKRYNLSTSIRTASSPISASSIPSSSSTSGISTPTSPLDHYSPFFDLKGTRPVPMSAMRRSASSFHGGRGMTDRARGSPRDLDEDVYRTVGVMPVEDDDAPFARPVVKKQGRGSNRGYFDLRFDLKNTLTRFTENAEVGKSEDVD
jgi:hypothetical protein